LAAPVEEDELDALKAAGGDIAGLSPVAILTLALLSALKDTADTIHQGVRILISIFELLPQIRQESLGN